jgi:hypothetical protein
VSEASLRFINDQPTRHPLHRLGNLQSILREVDIAPPEPEWLATAKAERRCERLHG